MLGRPFFLAILLLGGASRRHCVLLRAVGILGAVEGWLVKVGVVLLLLLLVGSREVGRRGGEVGALRRRRGRVGGGEQLGRQLVCGGEGDGVGDRASISLVLRLQRRQRGRLVRAGGGQLGRLGSVRGAVQVVHLRDQLGVPPRPDLYADTKRMRAQPRGLPVFFSPPSERVRCL